MFLPGHRNARTMRESKFSGIVAKGAWVPMGTIILTHMLTSLNNLLFTRGEEQFIQGRFNLNQQKFLLIQNLEAITPVRNWYSSIM